MDDYAHLRLHAAGTRRATHARLPAKRRTPGARRLRVARTGVGRSRNDGQKTQPSVTGRSKRAASAAATSLWNRLFT
jgi:hypothetical protein